MALVSVLGTLAALLCVALCYDDTDEEWVRYKQRFGKVYTPEKEALKKATFIENLASIARLNAESKTAVYGLTPFSDFTNEELQGAVGSVATNFSESFLGYMLNFKCIELEAEDYEEIEEDLDRVEEQFVSDVKDMGTCGACWAMAVVDTLETAWAVAKNIVAEPLSAQQIIDCDSPPNGGCKGGSPAFVQSYISLHGLTSESDYPYVGKQQRCKSVIVPRAKIESYCYMNSYPPGTNVERNMLRYVAKYGAVIVALHVNYDTFKNYKEGVITAEQCEGSTPHAASIVGYNFTSGTPYWILKNSMGKDWGENGFFKVEYGRSACGIDFATAYFTIES